MEYYQKALNLTGTKMKNKTSLDTRIVPVFPENSQTTHVKDLS